MHLFGHNLYDYAYYFRLPCEGERDAQSITGVLPHTIAMSGLSRVRTESFHLLVIPSLAPHPEQLNGQSPGHRYFGDLSSSPHRQVEILTAPLRNAARRNLGRFHQQEAQHRTPLFGDMPQPSPFPTRILQRHQSQIARDLLPTLKSFCSTDDQHESQCCQRAHSGRVCKRCASGHFSTSCSMACVNSAIVGASGDLIAPPDHAGVGSPRELTGSTRVVPVRAPAITSSCNVGPRSALRPAVDS